ncbi:hypothetical protein ScPMuIL_001115 [Solemya velum]
MMAGRVQNMLKYGIFVEFPGGLIGLAPTQYTTDKKAPDLSLLFHIGQSVLAKVIEVSAEKQRFLISLRMKDCYSGDHQPGIDLLKDYMQEKNKLLKSIVQIKDYHSKIGCVETAVVGSISKSGIHCHLPGGVKGFIPESQKKGLEIKEKEELEVVILNIDPLHSCLDLSACQNLVKLIKHRKDNKFSEAKVGQVIKSEVELVRDDFILVSLRGHTGGQLAYLPARRHLNDVLEQHQFDIGQPNAVVVKENADGQIIVVLQIHEAKAQEHANMLKREHSVHPGQMNVNKLKVGMTVKANNSIYWVIILRRIFNWYFDSEPGILKIRVTVCTNYYNYYVCHRNSPLTFSDTITVIYRVNIRRIVSIYIVLSNRGNKSGVSTCKWNHGAKRALSNLVSHPEDAPRLQLAAGFSWDTEFKIPEPEEPDNSSSDESESGKKQIKKKKTKEEKKKEKEEEEKKIFELERRRVEGEMSPETADDFDRLVLQSPNSSIVWLGYMAFHLETTEIDKARAIAERGLKTISFREEQEKMNLWIGYLNLENMYGTQETLDAVLSRAVQQSDALLVYQQMVHIYVQSGKIQAAEQLYSMIVKRYSQNKAVWIGFGQFLFKQAQCESARKLMQRCLKSLDKREHLDVISKFAMMEYKFPGGEPERGRTMFENILSNYPKRTDLWSVYIDMVTKQNDKEAARQLFDRVTCLKLPARKMKLFFKKYMDFEERHGDIGTVDAVKLKALQYVESQQHKDV